jgi:separase
MASVLHLYATGLHFSLQQIENEGHPAISVDFPKNDKNLQTLNSALGTLARVFCVTDGKSSQRDNLGKYASPPSDPGHPNKKHSYSYSVAYFDSLEFVCKILLQHANAVWKNFSEGKTVPNSRNMTCIFMALDQFIDFSHIAYR